MSSNYYITYNKVENSIPIAIDTNTGKIVRLVEGKQENPEIIDPFDRIKLSKKIKGYDQKELVQSFRHRKEPSSHLQDFYYEHKNKLEDNAGKEIIDYGANFIVIPQPKKESFIYLSGATGSGKTYYINQYIKQFKHIYPDRKIYVFSDVDHDPLIDEFKPIRIKIDEELVTTPLVPKDLSDSLIIMDDIDSIADKKIRNSVITLYNSILKMGRHCKISMLLTSHATCEGITTKQILINSHYIVYFKGALGLPYLFKKLGLSNEQIKKLNSVNSRAICIHKNYPSYFISQNTVTLL